MEVGIVVIGGGCIGLSVARSLIKRGLGRNILLVERHKTLGWETSSRSSEVIHASVYYPPNSLKAVLCTKGNDMMYDLCKRNRITHKKLGKLLVPQKESEVRLLGRVLAVAKASGGKGVRLVDREEIKELEPNVHAPAAIYCPTTGIVDSHELLQFYETDFLQNGGDVATNAEVIGIEKHRGIPAYSVQIAEVDLGGKSPKTLSTSKLEARCVINCAGLGSTRIAALSGIDVDKANYRLHPTKGTYFRATKDLDKYPSMLVYPLPVQGAVGVHTTPDCYNGMRLGPLERWLPDTRDPKYDVNYPQNRNNYIGSEEIDMSVPMDLKQTFVDSVKYFLPFITPEGLSPDTSGIHPKLQRENEGMMRDWTNPTNEQQQVIRHEHDRGLTNLFNLIGIESPGLTASPAIGEYVADMIQREMK